MVPLRRKRQFSVLPEQLGGLSGSVPAAAIAVNESDDERRARRIALTDG